MLIHDLVDMVAAQRPSSPYIRWPVAYSYEEFAERTKRVATWLASLGIRHGDRIIIFSRNRPEVLLAVFGAARIGAIFSVINGSVKPYGLQQIADQCEPSLILVDDPNPEQAQFLERYRVVPLDKLNGVSDSSSQFQPQSEPFVNVDPQATACLIFTSGSTGTPRGVVLSHANICFAAKAIQRRLQYQPDDIVGVFLPLSFDYGLYQFFIAADAGASLCLGQGEMTGPGLLRTLGDLGITVLPVVPALGAAVIKLLERQSNTTLALRVITNTGEQLPIAYITKLSELIPGVRIYPMYGLTECKRVSILLPEEYSQRKDSVGRALDGTTARIVDEDGETLPPDQEGELVISGPNVSQGYWNAPEETKKRFRSNPDGTRDLYTGDQCRMDAEGYLYFVARKDSLLKHRGFRLSPHEIENAAHDILGVLQSAVSKNKETDKLVLYVVANDRGLDEEKLWRELEKRLESYKLPDEIHLLDKMPQTGHGKIDRKLLAK